MNFERRAFCKCGFDAGEHLNGDVWFAQVQYPACPKCGEPSRESFKMKTVRWISNGWFKGGRYEEISPAKEKS